MAIYPNYESLVGRQKEMPPEETPISECMLPISETRGKPGSLILPVK